MSTREDEGEDAAVGKAAAEREKSVAERNFNASSLSLALKHARRAQKLCPDLPGVAQLVVSLRVHIAAATTIAGEPDWYSVLQTEPFSSVDHIKSQYRKLALVLHPDKSRQCPGAEDAFKLVGQAWSVLSDRSRRRIYDLKRRIELEFQTTAAAPPGRGDDTFLTECTTCKRLHEFERKFVGRKLVCPKCRKAFLATEFGSEKTPNSSISKSLVEEKQKMEENEEEEMKEKKKRSSLSATDSAAAPKIDLPKRKRSSLSANDSAAAPKIDLSKKKRSSLSTNDSAAAPKVDLSKKKRSSLSANDSVAAPKIDLSKKKNAEEGLDLGTAVVWKKKVRRSIRGESKRKRGLDDIKSAGIDDRKQEASRDRPASSELVAMRVDDSDFYDFDRDRSERSFNKGQVWAVYDDDDGMPRHYGLIDEIVSTEPFILRMSWLDLQNDCDKTHICWESSGFHVACGQFKIARRTDAESVNIFSHLVESVRVAREIYRIYPTKGSIWALYSDQTLDRDDIASPEAKRNYDFVVCLTNFTETQGLSVAYLEKVKGFKTIFKRREFGPYAVHWFGKDDIRKMSHQIPARKLSGREDAALPKEACWELDPASLSIA